MKRTIKLRESELRKMISDSVRSTINETLSHEDRLRQYIGKYASQIKTMLDVMELDGPNGKNYLRDLLQKQKVTFVDDLWNVYFEMKEFAKTSDQRRQEEEDLAAMPDGGWEHFGY